MLNVYPVVLDFITALRPLLAQIERRDRDLGRQLRRASSSVALNLAEGMYSRGELRTARYHTALGSMRESWSCLEVAQAFGYVRSVRQNQPSHRRYWQHQQGSRSKRLATKILDLATARCGVLIGLLSCDEFIPSVLWHVPVAED